MQVMFDDFSKCFVVFGSLQSKLQLHVDESLSGELNLGRRPILNTAIARTHTQIQFAAL